VADSYISLMTFGFIVRNAIIWKGLKKMTPKSIVECCDCMDFMEKFPDKYFNLAICDPPYGIRIDKSFSNDNGKPKGSKTGFCKASRTSFKKSNWDISAPELIYFKELERISINQIIWGANHFINLIGKGSPCWIVWDKHTNGSFADCELAYTSFKTAVRKFDFIWNGLLQQDMKHKETRIHPTQKPVALYIWQLKNYAKPGDKILDTHLGSQSSRIAARIMGFDFWGCEIDPDYFNDGCRRFEKEAAQEMLFQAPQHEKMEQPNLFNEEQS
jgi:site-specific DNA-methyltransferase (adenine-specific)